MELKFGEPWPYNRESSTPKKWANTNKSQELCGLRSNSFVITVDGLINRNVGF